MAEEWVNEIEEEPQQQQGERDSESSSSDSGCESVPHHKRFRLSPRSATRSTPSLAISCAQGLAPHHSLSPTDKAKLDQTRKQLGLIHSLIIRINEAHRHSIIARSLAPPYSYFPDPTRRASHDQDPALTFANADHDPLITHDDDQQSDCSDVTNVV